MKLPNNEIGISDINNMRECPQRAVYGMRRHTEGAEPPESVHPDTMYGTIFHDTVEQVEAKDLSIDEALQFAFNKFARFLEPDDLKKIREDLDLYWARQEVGVRTVANERELRVPLFEYQGEMIYFRCRIDRLYQRLDNESVFIHRDFKSSKWAKTEADVHSDTQMWSYNWAIYEEWPEVESLTQVYDQLRYGEVPTRKSDAQRAEIKEWLIRQVTAILELEEIEPHFNTWCPWCPLKWECSEIDRLSKFETARIKALTPGDDFDLSGIQEVSDKVPEVSTAIKTFKSFEEGVKDLIRKLPADRREALGWKTTTPNKDTWGRDELARLYERLGPEDFFAIVGITKTKVQEYLKDDPRLEEVLGLATKVPQSPRLSRISFD
jgi:hypothetical protein